MSEPSPRRAQRGWRRSVGVVALVALTSACGPPHIRPFTPRERKYDVGKYAATERGHEPAPGSIYSEAQAGYLEDTRALRAGDIVRICDLDGTEFARGLSAFGSTEIKARQVPRTEVVHRDNLVIL